jgi:hypothetical protein
MMQSASQTLLQLVGAKGYKLNHIAGRSTVDSRPFQIFEGSNDMLYSQISESVIKLMRKAKHVNLFEFLNSYELTKNAAMLVKGLFNFRLDYTIPQRKLVDLGKVLSRVISLEHVMALNQKGFSQKLIDNSIVHLQHEMQELMASFNTNNKTEVMEDYQSNSDWLMFT